MLDKHDDRVKTFFMLVLQAALYLFVCDDTKLKYLLIACAALYFISSEERRKYLRIFARDASGIYALLRVGIALRATKTIPQRFKAICEKHPNKIMIYFRGEEWTFQRVDEFSNRLANYFRKQGIKEGDNVAIFMETQAEYVPIWLGILKIGASASLINHNLRDTALIHCLNAVATAAIVVGETLSEAIQEIEADITAKVYCYRTNEGYNGVMKKFINFKTSMNECSKKFNVMQVQANSASKALYVFTSGTTGMPKAAVFTHDRYNMMATGINKYVGLKEKDVLYVTLPLYHTNGITIGVGQALLWGNTVALRKKFSTTHFWADCIRYKCTVFIYIGEICRYLLASPPQPDHYQHKVRLIIGNGLRKHIWQSFVRRFNITDVAEFYGSSEGIGSLMNNEGRVGSVGFKFTLLPAIAPMQLVQVQQDTEQPLRNADGRCVKVTTPGEPGMHIARIRNIPGQRFEGYADKLATNKKIIINVFEKGDQYYMSGDLFTFDDEGYLYFHDRTGDTFRWKGENVATTEVEQVISEITALKDTAVYGVEIPGTEGKAGMAAIADPDAMINLDDLKHGLAKRLPKYARPVFLRLTDEVPLTDTFKIKKKQFKDEGLNLKVICDRIYFYYSHEDSYVPLTTDFFNKIIRGEIAL